MNRSVCNFIAVFNQAITKKSNTFKCKNFRLAFPILDVLVKEGLVQYYTLFDNILHVSLRSTKNGLIVSSITGKSRPSK